MKQILKIALVSVLCCGLAHAQWIDPTASFRDPNSDRYVRLHYDNDYFTQTDQYYTQGYTLEWVHPLARKNPLTKALIRFKNQTTRYGLAFDHFGFTPTSIQSEQILYADRPFAACIALKTFAISTDTTRRARLTSALSTGMIGPVAFAEGMQRSIHRLMNGIDPRGWQFQIQNDLILSYELTHEHQIYTYKNAFSVNTHAQIRVGTLNNRATAGFTLMAGHFHSTFAAPSQKPFQCYLYFQPLVNLIAYDATLQGGVFNCHNPYTLPADQVNRTTFQGNAGVVVQYRKVYLEYSQAYLTQEFKTGMAHRWGGVRIGVGI